MRWTPGDVTDLRRASGLQVREFARAAGVSNWARWSWESGRHRPTLRHQAVLNTLARRFLKGCPTCHRPY